MLRPECEIQADVEARLLGVQLLSLRARVLTGMPASVLTRQVIPESRPVWAQSMDARSALPEPGVLREAITLLQGSSSELDQIDPVAHLANDCQKESAMRLDPIQIRTVLEGLPGWQVEDGALVRGVPVTDDSREALIEAIANASVDSPVQPEVHLQPDLVVLRVGDPEGTGVTSTDVDLAAAIDQVLVGSARDRGTG
jgi:pterin-4a-carbinolamine dehydratase